jgi:tRNA A37 N6-isopentenylltransferase MiaA
MNELLDRRTYKMITQGVVDEVIEFSKENLKGILNSDNVIRDYPIVKALGFSNIVHHLSDLTQFKSFT